MALVAGLFFLSGCKKDDSVNGGSSSTKQGVVYVTLETTGIASDILTVDISIDGKIVKTLDKNNKEFKNLFDIQNKVDVKVEPKFASVAAPTDKCDFGCNYSCMIGVTSDGCKSFDDAKYSKANISSNGIRSDKFEETINKYKDEVKTVTASYSNGNIDSFVETSSK